MKTYTSATILLPVIGILVSFLSWNFINCMDYRFHSDTKFRYSQQIDTPENQIITKIIGSSGRTNNLNSISFSTNFIEIHQSMQGPNSQNHNERIDQNLKFIYR